ncbi:hypothetical protein [Methanolobus halotolerans]|nr:hypothetical protein [Methanolobus halotolerans]
MIKSSPLSKKEFMDEINALVADSVESLWNCDSASFIQELFFFRRNLRLMKNDKFIENFTETKNELIDLKRKYKKLKRSCKQQREKEKNEIISISDVEIKYNYLVR